MIALILLAISGRNNSRIILRLEAAAAWGKVLFTIAVVSGSDYSLHAYLLCYNIRNKLQKQQKECNCGLLILKAGNSFPRWNTVSDATAEISALSQSSPRGCIHTLVNKTGNILTCMRLVSQLRIMYRSFYFLFFFLLLFIKLKLGLGCEKGNHTNPRSGVRWRSLERDW